ncbi:MAG TPA: tetratricopeptide repeat protein [Candidatus Obscuribacterales bacterium]
MRHTAPNSRSANLRAINIVVIALTGGCLLTSCGTPLGTGVQAGWAFGKGEGDYKMGKYDKAEAQFRDTIRISEDSPVLWMEKAKALVRLGQISEKRGRMEEAENDLDQALALFEKNQDSKFIKSNRLKVRTFWIEALHTRSAQLRNKPATASEADTLEAKAKELEAIK